MKRRNAECGKMRRPLKRTKIAEGMYGNSMLYLKFVMLWAAVVLADYLLEFRFEFLWPFWMMLRSVYDSCKYQGLAFSVFFICIALTSDMLCFFFIPLQYIFFAASTYVWVQYVWYSFAEKGVCLHTVAICCFLVYVEGILRGGDKGGGVTGIGVLELCRPLAAHCVGYPVVTLGFGVKSYLGHRLRLRRQRQVRAENEFYFQLMRDALPESALEQNQQSQTKDSTVPNGVECHTQTQAQPPPGVDARHMNGSLRRRCVKLENGVCGDHTQLQAKLDKLEKHLAQQATAREKAQQQTQASAQANTHVHVNGSAAGAGAPHDEDKHECSKGSAKPSKCEKKEVSELKTIKEEKRKKNKDKDKENIDSHRNTAEHTKEQIVKDKELESTKENVKSNRECNSHSTRDKERERDREREREMRERDREREREREREQREVRECTDELKRVKAELAAARSSEAEARRALQAAVAAERQRKAEYQQLKQAHAALQHKVTIWRTSEKVALERRLGEERRARTAAEHQLLRARHAKPTTNHTSGECEMESCKSTRNAQESEISSLRRDMQRVRERAAQLQRDLTQADEQVRALEARLSVETTNECNGNCAGGTLVANAWQALQERAAHLERSLSAETRVKLDLLSALGEAKRQLQLQEGEITRQEKELEELKAQMLAVMPPETLGAMTPMTTVSKLRLSDGSPLDPNASVYTPKQLCSDA